MNFTLVNVLFKIFIVLVDCFSKVHILLMSFVQKDGKSPHFDTELALAVAVERTSVCSTK